MASKYQSPYCPLNTELGEIRVLNVHCGGQKDGLILDFEVIRILNNSELDFDAISYQWGSQEGEHCIQLHNKPFIITSSLNKMIRDLRHRRNISRVWIDALCINQKDIPERNQQVQLMRKIYRCARQVRIWLDLEIKETDPAYQELLTFDFGSEKDPNSLISLKIESDLIEYGPRFWKPICDIARLEYFNRVWVQQEMSNAQRLSVQCRRTPIPTARLINFVHAWSRIEEKQAMGLYTPKENGHELFEVVPLRFFSRPEGGISTLGDNAMDLLEEFCRSSELQCTDERDIIYGLIFLAYNWQENDIVVNYSLPVLEVFREAMISYLRVYGSIEFLEEAGLSFSRNESITAKPSSWVPDWRERTRSDRRRYELKARVQGNKQLPQVAHVSGQFLYTTGIKLEEVYQYYGDMLGSNDECLGVKTKEFYNTFHSIVKAATVPEDLTDRSRGLFGLLMDQLPKSGKVDDNEIFTENYNAFISFGESAETISKGNDLTMMDFAVIFQSEMQNTEVRDTRRFKGMWWTLQRMKFLHVKGLSPFVGRTGSIGLAPKYTQPGDEVWLLPTCKRVIFLREQDQKYIVVGKGKLNNSDPWERYGGAHEHLAEGEKIGHLQAKAICLQ